MQNETSLNIKISEMVIFKSKRKKFECDLKIKLCGKKLYPTESVKYLGIKNDTNPSCQWHANTLFIRLNRANTFLFKIRKTISSIDFIIFVNPNYLSAFSYSLRNLVLLTRL